MTGESELVLALELVTEGGFDSDGEGAEPAGLESMDFGVFSTESYRNAAQDLYRSSRSWVRDRGIQGLGIGQKLTKGIETDELAMRVYVERKKPKVKLKNPVPKAVAVPEIGLVPTDVLEIGRVSPELYPGRTRPAMPGCGIGHGDVSVGTFGCLVRKKGRKRGLYILSNSHVLSNSGAAEVGDAIFQPGPHDGGGKKADVIAKLSELVPINFGTGYPNLVDAAIARVRSSRQVKRELRMLGVAPIGVSRTIRRGMRVKKVGRTTDFTIGVVSDVHYRLRMRYGRTGTSPGRLAGLRNQVLCTRFTGPGDSGSVVLNNRNRVVGLHFAGSVSTSIFNRIEHVFELLDVELA